MGPDDNIKKTARTRDNFSMYEQKNSNDNCNGFHRRRVQCRYMYTCFYHNICIVGRVTHILVVLLYLFCRVRHIVQSTILCLVVGAYVVLLQDVERKNFTRTWHARIRSTCTYLCIVHCSLV